MTKRIKNLDKIGNFRLFSRNIATERERGKRGINEGACVCSMLCAVSKHSTTNLSLFIEDVVSQARYLSVQ